MQSKAKTMTLNKNFRIFLKALYLLTSLRLLVSYLLKCC